jgi:hypothetical protein
VPQSSGSSRAASSVERTRSQNTTVSWRRSPAPRSGSAEGSGPGAGSAAALASSARPQPEQKRAPARSSRPQAEQRGASGAPQLSQKRASSGFRCWQLWQTIECIGSSAAQYTTTGWGLALAPFREWPGRFLPRACFSEPEDQTESLGEIVALPFEARPAGG